MRDHAHQNESGMLRKCDSSSKERFSGACNYYFSTPERSRSLVVDLVAIIPYYVTLGAVLVDSEHSAGGSSHAMSPYTTSFYKLYDSFTNDLECLFHVTIRFLQLSCRALTLALGRLSC